VAKLEEDEFMKRGRAIFISIFLIYISYFIFSAFFFGTGDYRPQSFVRCRIFSSNKKCHLALKAIYSPLCYLSKSEVHFLSESEFDVFERHVAVLSIFHDALENEKGARSDL
jgi:hypothetical protein